MKSNRFLGIIFLLVAAFLWGSTFVAQAETGVGPFTYLAMRSIIAVVFLFPIILVKDMYKIKSCGKQPVKKGTYKTLLIGLFLLCMTGNVSEFSFNALFSKDTFSQLSFNICDIYVLFSAVGYSLQIMAIDKYSPKVDCIKLSFLQFSVTAVLALVAMFILEKPVMADILDSWISILYAGILSSGVAYTLQILGQKYTPPTIASMLMSLESAFAVLSAIVFSSLVSGVPELPTGYEWIGIILMFSAIMISQIPQKKKEIDK